MRVLITGATGFIGRHLTAALISRGDEVHVITRPGSDLSVLSKAAIVHFMSSENWEGDLRATVASSAPDVTVHLASVFRSEHIEQDIVPMLSANVVFPTVLVDALVKAGSPRLINTGTTWQHYGDASYDPVCLYAATKEATESILTFYTNTYDIRVLTLILNDTYGPSDARGKLISLLFRAARTGESLNLSSGEQELDLLHVADAVAAYMCGIDRLADSQLMGSHEKYVVLSGEKTTLRGVVQCVEKVTGQKIQANWGARSYRAREVMRPWADGISLPNWRATVKLEDGLRDLANV